MVEERGQQNSGVKPDKIETIQTTEGSYEARLTEDNSNGCPIRRMMHLTRYSISKPPRMMRNIPKYYTTGKLQDRQVLNCDIRHPDPDRHLWNRRKESAEHADQECLISNMEKIQGKRNSPLEQNMNKKSTLQGEHQDKKRTKNIRTR